jgi:hypothetical protein
VGFGKITVGPDSVTLIVGIKTGTSIQLLSDTRISHPDVTQVEEIPGRLKIVILRPNLCVGYAGRANYAIDTVRTLASAAHVSAAQATATLQAANVESRREIDFLVACTEPALSLIAIQDGHATEVGNEAWIGDADGAQAYLRFKQSLPVPQDLSEIDERLVRTITGFSQIVTERTVPTVAGLVIRAGSTMNGFSYLPEARAYCPKQSIPSGIETALHFGRAAEGGFAYTLLVPTVPGQPLLAVHFYQGSLGYVYAPLQADRPVEVTNVTHAGLCAFVLKEYGIEVEGVKVG